MILYLCVLIVFLLQWESFKLILMTNPSLRWYKPLFNWITNPCMQCLRMLVLKLVQWPLNWRAGPTIQSVTTHWNLHLEGGEVTRAPTTRQHQTWPYRKAKLRASAGHTGRPDWSWWITPTAPDLPCKKARLRTATSHMAGSHLIGRQVPELTLRPSLHTWFKPVLRGTHAP
jgi:hypothetical protein